MSMVIEKTHSVEKPFAQGLSFYKLSLIFVTGSLIGTWYEELVTFIRLGEYHSRSGVMYGPFNPLYGVGFVLALVLLNRFQRWYVVVLLGAVLGGTFEYAANWAQSYFTGSVSWNYSELWLNINGRTTVIYALFWGLLCYVTVKLLYPWLSMHIERIPYKTGKLITLSLIVFLSLNMFISYGALIRQGLRHKGYEPLTPLGEIYDRYYTDARISELFPNMELLPVDDSG